MNDATTTGDGSRAPSDCKGFTPPSKSTRTAQASVECSGNAAGGPTTAKPDACERCKKKYTADGHVKPVHWARRSQKWLCLWCVFEMPDAEKQE